MVGVGYNEKLILGKDQLMWPQCDPPTKQDHQAAKQHNKCSLVVPKQIKSSVQTRSLRTTLKKNGTSLRPKHIVQCYNYKQQ